MTVLSTVSFDAATYAKDLREAGNGWRTAEGRGDTFARSALAALVVTDGLSPLALAISVYDEMEPKTAKGAKAEPKESDKAASGVSVSSLRSAKGGEGARSVLEAIFYVAENVAIDGDAVAAFIRNDRKAHKLFPLKAHIAKAKLAQAKAAKEAALPEGGADVAPKAGEDAAPAPVPAIVADVEAFTARIAGLSGEELAAASDAIADLVKACTDAAARLSAADTIQKAA